MQLKYLKDFIHRRATVSDQAEVKELVEKFGIGDLESFWTEDFNEICANSHLLSEVILNSNGVLIAFVLASVDEWRVLAANPNFLKTELRLFLHSLIKDWAKTHSSGKLKSKSKMITGHWKTFLKQQGVQIEPLRMNGVGFDQIDFS